MSSGNPARTEVRCPVCGEDGLSPLADLDAQGHVRLRFKRPAGFLEQRPTFMATLGRACRSCGVVLPFLNPHNLGRLARSWSELAPVVEPDDATPGTPPSPESPS